MRESSNFLPSPGARPSWLARSAAAAAVVLASVAAAPLDPSAFSYDASAPLNVRVVSSANKQGVTSKIVTFTGAKHMVRAEIIASAYPAGRHAGVLFVHWLGDTAPTTNHTEFESDARALAARGITSVLLDAMWSNADLGGKDWYTQVRSFDTDYANSIAQVIDLRRGLDLLSQQPGVDPANLAYVGHDFGSMYGAVLSGVDPRPRYYVLMAGTTTFSEWYLLDKKPADVAAYVAQMAPLDPLAYLSRSGARGFMFQFASHDAYITLEHETAFFGAAPVPRAMFLYDAHHDLDVPMAHTDRLNWLLSRLT